MCPAQQIRRNLSRLGSFAPDKKALHSAKGGVVETGCSDLYAVVY